MSKVGGGDSKNTLYCSFCGKSQHEVRKARVSERFTCDALDPFAGRRFGLLGCHRCIAAKAASIARGLVQACLFAAESVFRPCDLTVLRDW
jgi:hypothetical protein